MMIISAAMRECRQIEMVMQTRFLASIDLGVGCDYFRMDGGWC